MDRNEFITVFYTPHCHLVKLRQTARFAAWFPALDTFVSIYNSHLNVKQEGHQDLQGFHLITLIWCAENYREMGEADLEARKGIKFRSGVVFVYKYEGTGCDKLLCTD